MTPSKIKQIPIPSHRPVVSHGALVTIALALLASAGCRTLAHKGPVPEQVANCRQLSSQARTSMEKGDWGNAETLLSKAIQANPSDSEARRRYADSLWHRGAKDAAIAQLEMARAKERNDGPLAIQLGQMYLSLGKIDASERLAADALAIDSKQAAAWLLRGQVYETKGDVRSALTDYQRAAGYSADDPSVKMRIAVAYRKLGEPERALVALDAFLENCDQGAGSQLALYERGLAQTALGRTVDAVDSFRLAAKNGSMDPDLWCRLAQAEQACGRADLAEAAVVRALALDPTYPLGQELQSRLTASRASLETAIRR
jgi:tetratricopeptide (TPR) repeat protein